MELYVHIPFCKQKCRYCSFASFTSQEAYIPDYIGLILQEAKARKKEADSPIETVYIGGGTPSLIPPEDFARLIMGLREQFGLESVSEFTVEANPGTVTDKWLDTAVSFGINRLSLGMQACQNELLKLLGRIHRFEEVSSSVSLARKAGISNISLDLIFGIPTQSADDWDRTTDAALSLNPEHLSAYGLIPEPGTPLFGDLEDGTLSLPDPDEERRMYDLFIRKAAASGFSQYEISNFAQETFECRHNIGYWTQVPYLGLGVSAASMTGLRINERGMTYNRSVNPDTLDAYEKMILSGLSPVPETIGAAESRFETVMLGLRMNRGVSESGFVLKHRMTLEQCFGDKLEKMENLGLMVHENGAWKLTSRGFDIQNSILVELMED